MDKKYGEADETSASHVDHIPKVIYTVISVIYTICIIYIFFASIEYRLNDFTKKRLYFGPLLC